MKKILLLLSETVLTPIITVVTLIVAAYYSKDITEISKDSWLKIILFIGIGILLTLASIAAAYKYIVSIFDNRLKFVDDKIKVIEDESNKLESLEKAINGQLQKITELQQHISKLITPIIQSSYYLDLEKKIVKQSAKMGLADNFFNEIPDSTRRSNPLRLYLMGNSYGAFNVSHSENDNERFGFISGLNSYMKRLSEQVDVQPFTELKIIGSSRSAYNLATKKINIEIIKDLYDLRDSRFGIHNHSYTIEVIYAFEDIIPAFLIAKGDISRAVIAPSVGIQHGVGRDEYILDHYHFGIHLQDISANINAVNTVQRMEKFFNEIFEDYKSKKGLSCIEKWKYSQDKKELKISNFVKDKEESDFKNLSFFDEKTMTLDIKKIKKLSEAIDEIMVQNN